MIGTDRSTSSSPRQVGVSQLQTSLNSSAGQQETFNLLRHTIRDISGYHKALHHAWWNCDGTYLGVISADRTVRISQVDATPNKPIALQSIHSIPTGELVEKLAWHPTDSQRLAFCSHEKTVEIWEVRATRASLKLTAQSNNLNLAWSRSGDYLGKILTLSTSTNLCRPLTSTSTSMITTLSSGRQSLGLFPSLRHSHGRSGAQEEIRARNERDGLGLLRGAPPRRRVHRRRGGIGSTLGQHA